MVSTPDPRLFDPGPGQTHACPHCQARHPDHCRHDREREHGLISIRRHRPRHCIAAHNPSTAPWPKGF